MVQYKDDLFDILETGTLDECYEALSNFNHFNLEDDDVEELGSFYLPCLVVKTKTYVLTLSETQLNLAKIIKKKFVKFKTATLNNNNLDIKNVTKELDDLWDMVDSGRNFEWHLYKYNALNEKRKEYFTFDDYVKNELILNVREDSMASQNSEFLYLVKHKNELEYFWHYIYQGSIITNASTLLSLAKLFNFEEAEVELELKKHDNFFILQQKNNYIKKIISKKDFEKNYDVLTNSCYRVCGHRLEGNCNIFVYYESNIEAFEKNKKTNNILNPVMLTEAPFATSWRSGQDEVEGQSQFNSSNAFRIAVYCTLTGIKVIGNCGSSQDKQIEEFTLEQIRQKTGDSVNKALSKLDNFLNTLVDEYNADKNSKFTERIFSITLKNGITFIKLISCDKQQDILNTRLLQMGFFDNLRKIPKNILSENYRPEAIGIDFGTAKCCCAVSKKYGIEVVALKKLEEFEQVEMNKLKSLSQSTVDDKQITKEDVMTPTSAFLVKSYDKRNALVATEFHGKMEPFLHSDVLLALLKSMKTKAEEYQGIKLENVVITVPAIFKSKQGIAAINAAFHAGWKSVALLLEPIAAIFTYYIDRPIANNSTLLLFDLGGGTLDIYVFKIVNDDIEILSNNEDTKVSGKNFDNLLYEYFKRKLETDFNIDHIEKTKYKLISRCQEIKHNLSVCSYDYLDVNDIDTAEHGNIKITGDNFMDLSESLLEKIKVNINIALGECNSGIKTNEIDQVLLAGGGCRMPMIKNLLQKMFPHAEQICHKHPEEIVAIGAAHFATYLLSTPELDDQWIRAKDFDDVYKASEDPKYKGPQDNDGILLTIHQGPDEVVSKRTMESTATIYSDGRICGNTTLVAKHWILGFRGGVKIYVYDEKDNLLFESEWTIFGVNMYSDTVRRWEHTMPNPDIFKGKIKSAKIIHEHLYRIDGRRFNISF